MNQAARRMASATAVAAVLAAAVAAAGEGGFVPLFDGKSVEGWNQVGGKATYEVRDGCIVGSSVPNTQNSFLCPPKTYGDFVLEFEVKCDPALNSGVQIRSHVVKQGETVKRNQGDRTLPVGRMYGYQCEISHAKRGSSGCIYDEGRGGWIFGPDKASEKARKAYKDNQWNHYRIECKGNRIRTWVNGVPVADMTDDREAKGLIGFQVHGVGKKTEPLVVRWRHIRIKELK
jgi:hypothetical protein